MKLCGSNNGEFLLWSVDALMALISECEKCNQSEEQYHEQKKDVFQQAEAEFNLDNITAS